MKDIGRTTKQTEGVASSTLTAMFTTVSGKTIKPTVLVFITTPMVPNMKGTGLKISNMVRVKKFGLTTRVTREIIRMERSMVTDSSIGLTEAPTLVSLSITTSTARECILGATAVSMTDFGITTRCTEVEYLRGLMAAATKVNTSMTRNRVKVFSPGPTVACTRASGRMESNTAKESTTLAKVRFVGEDGKMERGFSGLRMTSRNETLIG